MRGWSGSDPGAGDLGRVYERIAVLADLCDHAEGMRQGVGRIVGASSEVWGGVAHDAWQTATQVSATAWGSLHVWASTEREALVRYTASVESIADRARGHQVRLLEDLTGSAPGGHSATSSAATRALEALAVERQQTEDDLAHAIGVLHADVGPVLEGWVAPTFSAGDYRDAGAGRILGLLAGFSPVDLHLLAADPSLVSRLQTLDPTEVAAWWRALSPAAQSRLIADSPELIGNLDGVAYAARDTANREVLRARLASLRAEQKRLESTDDTVVSRDGRPVKLSAPRLTAIAAQLAVLAAVKGAIDGQIDAPRYLVTLEDVSERARASVAIGDLDTADHVTYLVPGMGTTVARDMRGWTNAAERLLAEETKVKARSGVKGTPAAVSWIGYAPPGGSDVAGVLADDLARQGGEHLASDLGGLGAVRGWNGSAPPTSVVAHSYGTTTASFALQKVSAGNFVMLGSAGVPLSVRDASDLKVPAGHVASSLSRHDGWAPVGQVFGGRRYPTAEGFGSTVFSSDDVTIAGETFHGVTQHGPLVHTDTNSSYSYLDANTTALRSTALAALGSDPIDVP